MILQSVNGQRHHLYAPSAEVGAQPDGAAQLRGAHRGVVSGVREQNSPSGGEGGGGITVRATQLSTLLNFLSDRLWPHFFSADGTLVQ